LPLLQLTQAPTTALSIAVTVHAASRRQTLRAPLVVSGTTGSDGSASGSFALNTLARVLAALQAPAGTALSPTVVQRRLALSADLSDGNSSSLAVAAALMGEGFDGLDANQQLALAVVFYLSSALGPHATSGSSSSVLLAAEPPAGTAAGALITASATASPSGSAAPVSAGIAMLQEARVYPHMTAELAFGPLFQLMANADTAAQQATATSSASVSPAAAGPPLAGSSSNGTGIAAGSAGASVPPSAAAAAGSTSPPSAGGGASSSTAAATQSAAASPAGAPISVPFMLPGFMVEANLSIALVSLGDPSGSGAGNTASTRTLIRLPVGQITTAAGAVAGQLATQAAASGSRSSPAPVSASGQQPVAVVLISLVVVAALLAAALVLYVLVLAPASRRKAAAAALASKGGGNAGGKVLSASAAVTFTTNPAAASATDGRSSRGSLLTMTNEITNPLALSARVQTSKFAAAPSAVHEAKDGGGSRGRSAAGASHRSSSGAVLPLSSEAGACAAGDVGAATDGESGPVAAPVSRTTAAAAANLAFARRSLSSRAGFAPMLSAAQEDPALERLQQGAPAPSRRPGRADSGSCSGDDGCADDGAAAGAAPSAKHAQESIAAVAAGRERTAHKASFVRSTKIGGSVKSRRALWTET
jgi:hypothetical protein